MNYLSLLLPLAYLLILIGSLATFSYFYRRQQSLAKQRLEPWFPTHLQRDIYLSLLEVQAQPDTKVPDSVLKAALLRRAIEDIHRLISLRTQKPALMQLIQRGSVGDELLQRFQIAEKEMELELQDVISEANALAPQQNWGQMIFQSASEMAHKEMLVKRMATIEETRKQTKDEWQARRNRVAEGFAKELDGSTTTPAPVTSPSIDTVDVDEEKPRSKDGSSDDDLVKVEAGGPDADTGVGAQSDGATADINTGTGSSGGTPGKKKKKGKK